MTKKAPRTSPFGVRNVWCPRYSQCLGRCLESGAGGFSCQGCHLEGDHTGVPRDQAELTEDCRGCLALVISVFQKVKIQEALNRANGE